MAGPFLVRDIECWQGVDYAGQFIFFVRPSSGSKDLTDLAALDLTDVSLRMRIRLAEDPTATSVLALTSGAGLSLITDTFSPGPAMPSAPNGIKIDISKAQTLAMNGGVPFREGYYDVLADFPDGTTVVAMCGTFDLRATVTR